MFVAWRDLRFAKGRFALMGTVVVLITLLVGLLSGLTAGLARENTSAVTGLNADHLAFAAPPDGRAVSFTDSSVEESAWRRWAERPGVSGAEPLGIRTLNAVAVRGGRTAAVSAFGVEPDGAWRPPVARGSDRGRWCCPSGPPTTWPPGSVTGCGSVAPRSPSRPSRGTPRTATRRSCGPRSTTGSGSAVTAGPGPARHGDRPHHHRRRRSRRGRPGGRHQHALLADSLTAIGSYQAENGSLQLMRGFLFAISALVIGAFFTVWTIQRSGDVAVLKALGASTRYLLRDALGQAVVMLAVGTGVGTALASGLGALISGGAVPFVLDAATVLVPAAVMIVLGALGAALSIRRITAVDPLTALGSAR